MINFFRKKRKNLVDTKPPAGRAGKPMKYLRYAIGEIVLVMVAILLALQVNNWNENRKDREDEQIYLKQLLKELQADSRGWSTAVKYTGSMTDEAKINLEKISAQNVIDTALFVKKAFLIGSKLLRRPYIPTYDELIYSGKLSILENDSLKMELREYMGIFKWWENNGDYTNMQSIFKEYNDHMHQYFSPLIINEMGKGLPDELIPVEKLKLVGLDWNGYLSDQRSIYHLRKVTMTHQQLYMVYQSISTDLPLLIERVRRDISE